MEIGNTVIRKWANLMNLGNTEIKKTGNRKHGNREICKYVNNAKNCFTCSNHFLIHMKIGATLQGSDIIDYSSKRKTRKKLRNMIIYIAGASRVLPV